MSTSQPTPQQVAQNLTTEQLNDLFAALTSGNATTDQQMVAAAKVNLLSNELANREAAFLALDKEGQNLMAATKLVQESADAAQAALLEYESDSFIQQYLAKKSSTPSTAQQQLLAAAASSTEDDMEYEIASGSAAVPPLSITNKPVVKRKDILKNTKALRTAAKNLCSKIARLRARLVKYSEIKDVAQAKKHYQFRFCSSDDNDIHMYDQNRKEADEKISKIVVATYTKDVNEQITSAKKSLAEIPNILQKEFAEMKSATTSSVDLNSDETKTIEEEWDQALVSNARWLEFEITKAKSAFVPKVCKSNPTALALLNELLDQLTINIAVLYLSTGRPKAPIVEAIRSNRQTETADLELEETSCPVEYGEAEQTTKKSAQQGQGKTRSTTAAATTTTTTTATKFFEQIEGEGQSRKIQPVKARASAAASAAATEQERQQKQKQKARKPGQRKVFVNNASQQNISIPSYVFNTLNLGANYQIISFPNIQERKQTWKPIRLNIRKMILDSDSFDVNKKQSYINIMDAVQSVCINNPSYFNKTVAHSRNFTQAVKNNKLVKNVFNFLEQNNLMCILADKNLGLTIIDKSWYVEHMLKHFERSEVFDFVGDLSGFDISDYHFQPWLQTHVGEFLSVGNAINFATEFYDANARTVPQCYGLIKLHKTPYKLRYITPVVEWVNVKAAREVANRLGPFVKYFGHILSNSTELVRELEGNLAYDYVIMSFDVSDMYNSISQQDALNRIPVIARNYGWWDDSNNKWWLETMTLLEFVFDSSFVSFGGRVYKQKRGLPMGSPLSPVLANLYMAELEDHVLESFTRIGFTYYRYLDDILMVHATTSNWYKSHNNRPSPNQIQMMASDYIKELTAESNESIKFEQTGSAWKVGDFVEYLDLKVKIGHMQGMVRDKVINFELFDKPTNLHIYTDPSTFYPFHYVYNWIQGENIRLIRNSSTPEDYQKSLQDFKMFLVRRKYGQEFIDQFVNLNYFEDRDELLRHEKPHLDRKDSKGNIVTKYVAVRNSGTRPLVTKAINVIDNLCQSLEIVDFRIQPVVSQGSTLVSVLNKAKKNLQINN